MKISDLFLKSDSFANDLQNTVFIFFAGVSMIATFNNPVTLGLGVFSLIMGTGGTIYTTREARKALNNPDSQYAKEVKHAEGLFKGEKVALGLSNLSNYTSQLVTAAFFVASAAINPIFSLPAAVSFFGGKFLFGTAAQQINDPNSWYNKRGNKNSDEELQEASNTIQNQVQQSLDNGSKIENEFEVKQASGQIQQQSTHVEQAYDNNIHEEERSAMSM